MTNDGWTESKITPTRVVDAHVPRYFIILCSASNRLTYYYSLTTSPLFAPPLLLPIPAATMDLQDFAPQTSLVPKERAPSSRDSPMGSEHGSFQLQHVETFQTTYEQAVEGKLYHEGQLIKQPAPTRDPKDPLNLPLNRKILGVFCLSFFGALAASAEIILGACLPVFALQYAGLDPKILDGLEFPAGSNPLAFLEQLGQGRTFIFRVYLLAALPLLVIGVSNLFLIPVAIAVGRRPVVLITGCIAIAGAVWAGNSQSLGSHIGARCVQAIGAGTVESLIPFIVQDLVHVHERNTWISAAFAAQGVIIIAIGFSAPYMVVNLTWRWIYFVTSIAAAVFLVGIYFFLPETRWQRTRSEMSKCYELQISPRILNADPVFVRRRPPR